MRVLFACTALASHGGIQRFNRNLISALGDLGAYVDVVSLNDSAGDGPSAIKGIQIFAAGRNKLLWGATMTRLLVARRYDHCVCGHLHLAALVSALLRICRQPKGKSILVLHGIEAWGRVSGWRRRGAGGFARVLAVSNYTAKSFVEQMGDFPASAVIVFPNTVSHDAFCPPPRVEEKPNVLRLVSVTRLARSERDKGILDVLAAVAALRGTLELRYVIVGDGDDRAFLEAHAQSLGISTQVEFAGALSDVCLWTAYASSDAFVLPSRKEGFGIVFLEAMRFGLPVIGAREKGALDVIQENVNGLLVNYGDIAAISRALRLLANDLELRHRLGAAGKAMVESGGAFSFEAFRARCQQWILAA
jgi:glycosyltransferase involved in cell wall biosynthesis